MIYGHARRVVVMASLFECEVRYVIENIEVFEKRLKKLGAKVLYTYEFTDYYFRPVNFKWDPFEKNLRIREWQTPKKPTTIYFVKNELVSMEGIKFKRALYSQGKVALFSGDLNVCKSLLEDMGFELWFVIKKNKAKMWELPKYKFKTAVEYIEKIGWSGELEFEGEDIKKAKTEIEKALKILEIPKKSVSFNPISIIFAEKKGIL